MVDIVPTLLTDLKLIDELLVTLMWAKNLSPSDLEDYSSVTIAAMARLRRAYCSREMKVITASLARHFRMTENV